MCHRGGVTKTTRIPNAYASVGSVRQHSGSLAVYRCNTCGGEVVWADSKRTGRKYLVSVSRGYLDQRFYRGNNVHPRDCGERVAAENATILAEHERATAIRAAVALTDPHAKIAALDAIIAKYGH